MSYSAWAAVLFVLAFVPYWRGVIGRKITPSRISWPIWFGGDLLTYFAMRAAGTATWFIKGAVFAAIFTSVLAQFYGDKRIEPTDKWCFILGIAGLALWNVSGQSEVGLLFGLIALLVAAIPTFRIAWHDPHKSGAVPWAIWSLSCAFALLSVPAWNLSRFVDWGQPVTFSIIDMGVFLVILGRRVAAPSPTHIAPAA